MFINVVRWDKEMNMNYHEHEYLLLCFRLSKIIEVYIQNIYNVVIDIALQLEYSFMFP